MKKLEGILFILAGVLTALARPITTINPTHLFAAHMGNIDINYFGDIELTNGTLNVYSTSPVIYLISIIFIIIGIIKVKEAKKYDNKRTSDNLQSKRTN